MDLSTFEGVIEFSFINCKNITRVISKKNFQFINML